MYEIAVYDEPSSLEIEAESNSNILLGSFPSAKSTSFDSIARNAIDENGSTWWCAADGSLPQWIAFDLHEPKPFNSFSLLLYGGTTEVSYIIEGSNDGENWTTIHESVKEKTVLIGNVNQISGELQETCNMRHLRITFNEFVGNWAAVVEAEAHLITEAEDETLPTYNGTLQVPDVFCVGSHIYTATGEGSNTVSALTDRNPATEWKSFAPAGSQTILMDLQETKTLYGIEITMGKNGTVPPYRIEAPSDGVNWTILADATLRSAQTFHLGGRIVISETLTGEYRYVKLLWLNASSNAAVKTIGEISLYAEGETPAKPESADPTALVKLYNEVRVLNNSSKTYTAPSFRALSLAIADAAKVLARPDLADSTEISAAEKALQTAYTGLIKADPNIQGPQNVAETPSNNDNSTDQTPIPVEKPSLLLPLLIGGAALVTISITGVVIFNRKKR